MLALDVYHDGDKTSRRQLKLSKAITVGREEQCDLVLPDDPLVSRRHLTLEPLESEDGRDRVMLRDPSSTNGTIVNGERVRESVLVDGDEIRVGATTLRVRATTRIPAELSDAGNRTIVFHGNPFRGSSRATSRLEALHDLAVRIPVLHGDALYQAVGTAARSVLDFDVFCFLLVDDAAGSRVVSSLDRSGPCSPDRIAVSKTVLMSCLESGQPIISEDLRQDERFRDAESVAVQRLETALCAPLFDNEGNLGVLYVSSRAPGARYEQEDLQFLVLLASHLSIAVRHRATLARTELESRKREAILEHLAEGVIVCDSAFRILTMNSAAVDLFGRRAFGDRFEELLTEGEWTHDFHPRTSRVRGSFEIERRITRGVRAEFESLYYQATVGPVAGLERDGWRHIVCIRDVTRDRNAQARRTLLTNRLAHKLRTPLTVVQGSVSMLAEDESLAGNADVLSLAELANEGVREMALLVERFVQVAESDERAEGRSSTCEIVPLGTLLDAAQELVATQIAESTLRIRRSTPQLERLRIDGRRDGLVKCFAQLIDNAAKFAGAKATLEIEIVEAEESLTIAFHDDGPGIRAEDSVAIFDLFHQVDEENTGSVPGVGLGLWWARDVAQAHGGDLKLVRRGGGGARFEIVLPTERVAGDEDNGDTVEAPAEELLAAGP